ncbi:hypothetical protein CONPUDRAFT_169599 [Coniophora puteana RWD-64-598 SS2]|uniref:F-box domain-containing protein n=1 Tax=Coniophora puteana (strain RWD-64-598) TaxID=741705 RepID=A0A5M3M973_CONPW|nr:uncharacterized protein CONPUDRAFT_169599 [Coniophora puteana RWD-64-598 SS2]EIW75201.1 hypothetical protein CONPUDRAFT_169599 [Coniophora puteana RWD-64-598 SS2]
MSLCTKDFADADDRMLTLTHVCQQWRQVALSFPHLWFKVRSNKTTDPDKVRAILERSKSTLLDVEVNLGESVSGQLVEVVRQVLDQTSRMRTLVIQGDDIELARPSFDTPAPFLEELALINDWEAPIVAIDDELFDEETPSLRELVLHGCVLRWDSPIFSGLTRLSLFSSPFSDFGALKPDVRELSIVLHSCGNTLERLELCNFLESSGLWDRSWDTLSNAVKLPRLKFAILSEFDFFTLVSFFKHVNISPAVPINVWNVDINNPRMVLPSPIPLLPSQFFISPDASPAPSKCLQLIVHTMGIDFHVYEQNPNAKVPWYRYMPSDEDHFFATFCWPLDEDNIQVITQNVHGNIPFSDIHTLEVEGGYLPAERSFWDGLFRNTARVHNLILGTGIAKKHLLSVFHVLAPDGHGSSQKASTTLLLPHLTRLHFATPHIQEMDPELVTSILKRRKQAGAKVETITIHAQEVQGYADAMGATVVQ